MNEMPNRLDMMRAQAETPTPPMVGPAMPPTPMPEEPMMPEEPVADDTSAVASAIASAALANSGTPEEALKALIEAADQIRETLT